VLLTQESLSAASIPDLAALVNNSAGYFLHPAQAARELVNRRDPAALPVLLAARGHPDWKVRMQIPRGLVHLAAVPEQAVPVLRDMLDDADEVVQSYAAWALERFGQGNQAELLAELVRQGKRKPSKSGASDGRNTGSG
jgi:HEAT repeat protein